MTNGAADGEAVMRWCDKRATRGSRNATPHQQKERRLCSNTKCDFNGKNEAKSFNNLPHFPHRP